VSARNPSPLSSSLPAGLSIDPQLSDTSIIRDASEYIKELKLKVVRLNQEIAGAQQNALRQTTSSYPTV
jgi:hypothetical protein